MHDYHNSVSDKLLVFNYPEFYHLCVIGKDHKPKFYASSKANSDWRQMGFDGSIFSETYLIHCNVPFTLCPLSASDTEAKDYYEIVNPLKGNLKQARLNDYIKVVFEGNDVTEALSELLVKPIQWSDLNVLHAYKGAMSRVNAIFFSLVDGQLVIRAYSADRLLLANKYPVENKDDIFYFIMFAVDQLKLDISSIHFEFLGPAKELEEFKKIFQNYLPRLHHMPNLLVDSTQLKQDSAQQFEEDWLAAMAVQCV